jgi:hypothetical protein
MPCHFCEQESLEGVFASRNLGIQGRSQKRSGKRRGQHRGTGRGAPGGSGGLGRGGPEEAEGEIVIAEALEITVT